MINLTNTLNSDNFSFLFPKDLDPVKFLEKKVAIVAACALLFLVACLTVIQRLFFNKKVTLPPIDPGNSPLKTLPSPNKPNLSPAKEGVNGKGTPPILKTPIKVNGKNEPESLGLKNTMLDPNAQTNASPHASMSADPNSNQLPEWLNAHPDQSVMDLGITVFDEIANFLKIHGKQIECLNLGSFACINDEIKQFIEDCPQLKILSVSSPHITNCALSYLKEKPLVSLSCKNCDKLSGKGLRHIKGLKTLTSVDFSNCKKLNDFSIKYLSDLPLTHINFSGCDQLTDKVLEHLKKMPLISINFDGCNQMTSAAIDQFKSDLLNKSLPLTKDPNNPQFILIDIKDAPEDPSVKDNPQSPKGNSPTKEETPPQNGTENKQSGETPPSVQKSTWKFWTWWN